MSTCISRHGEYSEHTLGDDFVCTLCFVTDEDALIADRDRYKAHSVTLNSIGFRLAEALTVIPIGAERVEADPADLLERLIAERDQARATVERVRALHQPVDGDQCCPWCAGGEPWPCPTVRALDGAP